MQTSVLSKTATPLAALDPNSRAGKYLIFHLGEEQFGTDVLKVREIMGMQEITNVPQTPPFVKGVLNLRGRVIPVVDLRLKFGLEELAYTPRTCIIVIRTQQGEEDLTTGMIVDGVAEVLMLAEADIEDTPDFGAGATTPCVKGMAKVKGKVKILLDIDKVLSFSEFSDLNGLLH